MYSCASAVAAKNLRLLIQRFREAGDYPLRRALPVIFRMDSLQPDMCVPPRTRKSNPVENHGRAVAPQEKAVCGAAEHLALVRAVYEKATGDRTSLTPKPGPR